MSDRGSIRFWVVEKGAVSRRFGGAPCFERAEKLLRGYLAHKRATAPEDLPKGPMHSPTVGS